MLTTDELLNFITTKMKMQQIYQPLLIKTLIDCGGAATVRQLANVFVQHDESQVRYYEGIIKSMPMKVLRDHGVVSSEDKMIKLNLKRFDFSEGVHIKRACDEAINNYLSEQGLGIWDHRLIENRGIRNSIRLKVLVEGKQQPIYERCKPT